ncbi:MAG: hypothetical protein ABJC66_10790 [Gammaproteobacteria bacterium]
MQEVHYLKGLATIRGEIDRVLADRGITADSIAVTEDGVELPGATFTINANGKEQGQAFTYSEIEDSGEAIDAPAATKVRMLVSHFLG